MKEISNLAATIESDCLIAMEQIPDNSIDMVLADLPYGVTRNKWDSVIPLDKLWEQYKRVCNDNAAIVLFGQGLFSAKLILSNEEWFRYSLVWHKTNPSGFLNARKMPLRSHEDILVFYKNLPTYNPQKTTGHPRKTSTAKHKRNSKATTNYGDHDLTTYDSTERFPTSILKFKKDVQKSALHPTQKPVALCEYLIETYTNPGDTVLDNTAGSGTTGVASIKTGRRAILIEKDPEIYRVMVERLNELL